MSRTFAEIVEDVKRLSAADKEQLHTFLRKYVIENRRLKIRENENADASLEEHRLGELKGFTDVDDLMKSLT